MSNYTINYVARPTPGSAPLSYSNTITDAPDQDTTLATFNAVMGIHDTHITSIQETTNNQEFVCPVSYHDLEQLKK